MLSRVKRLVHVHDLWSPANAEPWTINPRTGFLETRAPLTWTGVRDYYPRPGERIRVLRRPEQVEAPKHLARCRMLTATEGHPIGDERVSPANVDKLKVGYTGDSITIEVINGYRCPAARVVATRATTQELIKQGRTQTSLGYHALWVGPPDDERGVDPQGKECGVWQGPHGPEYYDLEHVLDPDCELVQTLVRETGFDPEVLGPNHFAIALDRGRGGVQSELMRVVDSADVFGPRIRVRTATRWLTCSTRVFDAIDPQWQARKLATRQIIEDVDTIPKCTVTYGTNEFGVLETSFHFDGDPKPWTTVPAKTLDEITKEFIIDLYLWSRDPHDEIVGPNGEQLPECEPSFAAPSVTPVGDAGSKWTVGTSAKLPFAPADTEWDGDKAAASVFAWAGFDDGKPDPARARQAFLAYDANAPELKGSYKLPIARHRDGVGLEVVKAGLDAAAGYLPNTDIPQEVRDRARKALDAYYEKFRKQGAPARDHADPRHHAGHRTMTKQIVPLALSRDLVTWATKHNIPVPVATRDEMDPEVAAKVLEYCSGIEAMCASMREMMGSMSSEIEDMKAEKGAMSSKVSELEAQKMELEKQIEAEKAKIAPAVDAAKQTCDSLAAELAAAKQQVDALTREVAPLREAELVRVRAMAVKAGVAKDAADKMSSISELRRAALIAKLPTSAQSFRDADDHGVALAFSVIEGSLAAPTPLAAPKAEPQTAPMPAPSLGRQTNDAAQPKPASPPSQFRRVAANLSGTAINNG